jgi:DNA-binding NtrC family response regulator
MPKLTILVVDDESIVGKRLKPALEKSGYAVDVVETGADAMRLLDERAYDIVVTDIRMEDVDGMDVLRRAQSKSPKPLVIMITGYATVDVARDALTIGAFDFIAKPFRIEDLRAVLARAAERIAVLRSG